MASELCPFERQHLSACCQEERLCQKQSAQASLCMAPPRSGTVSSKVHSTHAAVKTAFLWKKPTPRVQLTQVELTPILSLPCHSPQLETTNKGRVGGKGEGVVTLT